MQVTKVLILICLLLTAGCNTPVPTNRIVFDNSICKPPCWQNITPGVTTKEDALAKLSNLDIVEQPVADLHAPTIGFDDDIQFSLYKRYPVGVWVYILGDRVSVIAFDSNLGITMQRAMDLFGAPESILLVDGSFFDQITLLNTQKGIAFGYKLFGNQNQYLDSSSIEPDTEIFEVTFFDPSQFQKVVSSGILSAYTQTTDATIKSLRPWQGYGSFKDKYWPPATRPPG